MLTTTCGGLTPHFQRPCLFPMGATDSRGRRRAMQLTSTLPSDRGRIPIRFRTTSGSGVNLTPKPQIQCELSCSHCHKPIRYESPTSNERQIQLTFNCSVNAAQVRVLAGTALLVSSAGNLLHLSFCYYVISH